MPSTPLRTAVAAVLTALAVLGAAETASAGEARLAGTRVIYDAPGSAKNKVFVTVDPTPQTGGFLAIVEDELQEVDAGSGCRQSSDPHFATCEIDDPSQVEIYLGEGDDFGRGLGTSGLPVRIEGAGGDDTLLGDGAADFLDGGADDDTINGLAGNDDMFGRGGNDTISEITGFNAGGADLLDGGLGDDVLEGGNGNDDLIGYYGADELDGGFDTDTFSAGVGDDVIDSRDGRNETVGCGLGLDRVKPDLAGDQLFGTDDLNLCEVIIHPVAGGGTPSS
jgi:Ca2+-binding RTX toxin-like protein